MRELNFIEKGKLEWRETDDPRLQGDGEALVRPLSVATCDLDKLLVMGLVPVDEPFPFGHECVAEVTEVGDSVDSVKPGDVVSVPFQISCGECETCRRGHTGNCERVERMAMYGLPMGTNYGGFLSDTARVPFADAMLVPIPDDVEPASVASLSDNIPDAYRNVGPQLEERPGSPVLIAASGATIALYTVSLALALGAERVDLVGGNSWLRAKAEELGANLLDERFPKRLGPYPITVDASGDVDGLHCAVRSTEPEGICTSIGIYFTETTPVPLFEMFSKGIRFHTGRVQARPAMEPILELVRSGEFKPELATGETADWDDAPEAVANHRSKLVISRARARAD
jgi:alcohol dehydrogenase